MIDQILSMLGKFINGFNIYAKEYPMVAGAVSLWGLSVISYLARGIPNKIWLFIKEQSTTRLSLVNTSQSYHDLLKWLDRNNYVRRIRSLKISCGLYGCDEPTKSIGYGAHYFVHKFRPFKIRMTQLESVGSSMEKDQIVITVFGRSQNFFNKIFKEIKIIDRAKSNLIVYRYNRDCWARAAEQRKRDINTVCLNENIINKITCYVENFIDMEEWYVKHGLSYQTGLLLYGPPGCGKTSMVKALSSKLNKDLYVLSASHLNKIEDAMLDLPENSILLIEDIDTEMATNTRIKKAGDKSRSDDAGLSKFSFVNLSDVLNSIDGVISCHGRILIATTNYKEKLDEALIRDGRFDLKIELKHADNYAVRQFFKNYYPDFIIPEDFEIRGGVSAASIQNLILKGLNNPNSVLNAIKKDS